MTDALAPRPVLHLSGPKLRAAMENLVRAGEMAGGIERYAAAVRLKSEVFRERLENGKADTIERGDFDQLVPLMTTVRRRFDAIVQGAGWPETRSAIADLLRHAHVPGTGDARMAAFALSLSPSSGGEGRGRHERSAVSTEGEGQPLAQSRQASAPHPDPLPLKKGRGNERVLRDLAAELLHNVYPEHHPLMTRWVWDATTNTGALREIWHDPESGDDVDHVVINVPDTHEAFLVLREELAQFLADNGVYRDVLWYVDLLKAQIYGDYINAQGGAYLKTDFTAGPDLLEQSRRILGLDRVHGRKKGVAGEAVRIAGELEVRK